MGTIEQVLGVVYLTRIFEVVTLSPTPSDGYIPMLVLAWLSLVVSLPPSTTWVEHTWVLCFCLCFSFWQKLQAKGYNLCSIFSLINKLIQLVHLNCLLLQPVQICHGPQARNNASSSWCSEHTDWESQKFNIVMIQPDWPSLAWKPQLWLSQILGQAKAVTQVLGLGLA